MKEIRIDPRKEPERYEAFMDALNTGAQVEGGYIMQYTEYREQCELVCKFILRPPGPQEEDPYTE